MRRRNQKAPVFPFLISILRICKTRPDKLSEYFYPQDVDLIEKDTPDIVGFNSMAVESHLYLETTRLLKERNSNIINVFGGPHFGAIAAEVLEHYEWTDYVIAGEGEASIKNLFRYLESNERVTTMDNIAYRNKKRSPFTVKVGPV